MKVTMRPATKLPQIIIHHKVAAYCRVSTQQEIQHHSLEAQLCCVYTGRGSEPTAASGGRKEASEWQRSIKSRKCVSPKILSGTATGLVCIFALAGDGQKLR